MATSATWMDRLMGKSGVEAHAHAHVTNPGSVGRTGDYRLRPFPNESIHFFTKRIDNSRVIRQADPQAPRACWQLIGGASASAALLIGMLLPTGYRVLAGYQIDDLKREEKRLLAEKDELELEKSKLLSAQRLAALAKSKKFEGFIDPHPSRVVHLGKQLPPAPTALAMRRAPAGAPRVGLQAQAAAAVPEPAPTALGAMEAAPLAAAGQPEQENP